ncbi:MAG TPA: DUF4293 domain-containing protein [Candidatus Coprenecus stercoravium]|uniref:DUF4293 domain-containing protein n=1 Tax=Candidatus Coprenecus stercoravium TaxID=2840735 RepID=A0A9D2GRM8_9BACT|nr:DUF4293 domain-containing protein [Candidatus Coprenecus stercoravium]
MIQRIQTLFLTIAAGLLIAMFFTPMIRYVGSDVTIPFVTVSYKGFTLTTIFSIVCTVLSVALIFMYKNRIRQIRLCNLNSLILLGYQVIIAVYFFQRGNVEKFGEGPIFTVPCIFPLCAAVLTFIAMRYIARDEAIVMASTRLRGPKKSARK